MTSMALTPRSTDPLSSMKAVRKGVFDPVARELPGLDDVDNKKISSNSFLSLSSSLFVRG